jgi:hypothetical protein
MDWSDKILICPSSVVVNRRNPVHIGLIVYSQTGHTLSVAETLRDQLAASGHGATLEQIEVEGEVAPGRPVQFKTTPDPTPYDALVLAAPTQAFSLVEAMKGYLAQVDSLQGKPVACLTTQHFPYAWMGGNRAIRQMKGLVTQKGGSVLGSGIVNWSRKSRERQIQEVTDSLCGLF